LGEALEALVRDGEASRPRFLLLDPLVRLHGIDENHAGEVACGSRASSRSKSARRRGRGQRSIGPMLACSAMCSSSCSHCAKGLVNLETVNLRQRHVP
jgi:hypothetical protein